MKSIVVIIALLPLTVSAATLEVRVERLETRVDNLEKTIAINEAACVKNVNGFVLSGTYSAIPNKEKEGEWRYGNLYFTSNLDLELLKSFKDSANRELVAVKVIGKDKKCFSDVLFQKDVISIGR